MLPVGNGGFAACMQEVTPRYKPRMVYALPNVAPGGALSQTVEAAMYRCVGSRDNGSLGCCAALRAAQ